MGNGGGGSYSDVIAGLQWAVDNGMQVTNNSYGSTGNPGETVKDAFDNAYAAGLINIAAAGNTRGGDIIYPAKYESVVAVSTTTDTDSLASFSSVGTQIELATPGQAIYSTYSSGGYATLSGTSMASPHVAGTAALVIATGVTDDNGINGIADEVRQQLQEAAEDLAASGNDDSFGCGLVDASAAAGTIVATGSIAGKVANATDGTPISGATVSVDTGQSATTDANDDYTIADVATGDHTITASADGFDSASQTVTVSENATTTADFALSPMTTTNKVIVDSIIYTTEGGKNSDKHLSITVALVDDLGRGNPNQRILQVAGLALGTKQRGCGPLKGRSLSLRCISVCITDPIDVIISIGSLTVTKPTRRVHAWR